MPTTSFTPLSFSDFIDALTADAMLAFIEEGRASLLATSTRAVEQGFLFLTSTSALPAPKDPSVIGLLVKNLQVALLDGLVREGTRGVRSALQHNYECLHQAAKKYTSAGVKAEAPAPERTYESIVLVVCAVVADHLSLDLEAVSPHSALVDDLGSDSLDIVDFTMLLDSALGINIEVDELGDLCTVKDLVRLTCKHVGIVPQEVVEQL